jgi:hypothetical protein
MKEGWYRIFVPDWTWAREFLIVVCVLSIYFAVNIGSSGRGPRALENTEDLISLEKSMGIFQELWVQKLVIDTPMVPILNAVYMFVHPLITIGFIVVLFLSGSDRYPYVRNVFFIFSISSFVVFYLYPAAPPRLMSNYGFVDLLHEESPINYETGLARVYLNPYAAMPSIHLGYSTIIGAMIFKIFRNRVIIFLGLAYPMLMSCSIIASANHLIIDGLVSVLFLALIYYLVSKLDLPDRLIRNFKGILGRGT